MKRYKTYFDSHVNWLGNIPSTWILSKLKYEVKCLDGSRVPIEKSLRAEGPYPYWGAGSITGYINDYLFDEEIVLLGEDGAPFFDPYRPVAFYVNEKVWVNNHMHVLRPLNRVVGKYLTYLLNIVDYGNHINGSILNKLTQSNMDEIAVCLPTIDEQKSIVTFLDHKVGQIDETISNIEQQIDALKSYRQSIISETVTKGLDKNAKKKESGVEWIGEIPERWEIVPLKHYLSLKGRIGWNGLKSEEFKANAYAYLVTGQDFNSAIVNWGKCYQIDKERYDEDPFIQLQNGDILVTKDGTIGKIAKVSNLDKPACLNSGIFVVKQKKGRFVQDYLYWLFVSDQLKEFVEYNSTGSTIQHLYQNVFENMPLTLPSIKEQEDIANYLNTKTVQIDEAISALTAQKEDLITLKQSIINEAVTGKIDVRDWTPSVEQ